MPKIIFLDIDGVLNIQDGKVHFISEKIKMLEKIIIETNAKIVITSSWRYHWEEINGTIEYIIFNLTVKNNWKKSGLNSQIIIDKIVDFTPIVAWNPPKGWTNRPQEIKKYIEDNNIDEFIVIDDWNMEKEFPNRMINPQTKIGLTNKLMLSAIKKLKGVI